MTDYYEALFELTKQGIKHNSDVYGHPKLVILYNPIVYYLPENNKWTKNLKNPSAKWYYGNVHAFINWYQNS